MTARTVFDAVIIGGGPAGSTAANLLAQRGRSVLVLEKERFPRHHIGESLLPVLNPLFHRLGVAEALKRSETFVKTGGSYIWGRSNRLWSIPFVFSTADGRRKKSDEKFAYHVDRAHFDQMLLKACARRGAQVREESTVVDVKIKGSSIKEIVYKTQDGKVARASARFYFDASGQSGVLAGLMGWRVYDKDLRHMAVYSYFDRARLLPGFRSNHILVVNVPNGWLWYIPLTKTRVSVGFVTSIDRAGECRADLDGFFERGIRSSSRVSRLLKAAVRTDPVRVLRDWSYKSRRVCGDNFFLTGDAAAFVDPLLSYGVSLAMHSAALAADCAEFALENPLQTRPGLEYYESWHRARFDRLLDFVKYFYDANRHRSSYFWKARRMENRLKNDYLKYAFTYVISGFTLWDGRETAQRNFFHRFFKGLGAPVEDLSASSRFMTSIQDLEWGNLRNPMDFSYDLARALRRG